MHGFPGCARQRYQVFERRGGRPGRQPAHRGIADARVAGLNGLAQRRQRAVVADGAYEPDERSAGRRRLRRFPVSAAPRCRSGRSLFASTSSHGSFCITAFLIPNANEQR